MQASLHHLPQSARPSDHSFCPKSKRCSARGAGEGTGATSATVCRSRTGLRFPTRRPALTTAARLTDMRITLLFRNTVAGGG